MDTLASGLFNPLRRGLFLCPRKSEKIHYETFLRYNVTVIFLILGVDMGLVCGMFGYRRKGGNQAAAKGVSMFVLVSNSKFFTGRVGVENWLSTNSREAFIYTGKGEAERKAEVMNRMSALHGETFVVEVR